MSGGHTSAAKRSEPTKGSRGLRRAGRALAAAVVAACLAGACSGELLGLDPAAPPLARLPVEVQGELAAVVPEGEDPGAVRLRVALVWGAQSQPEPLCFLPPESPEAERVVAAGCRDPLGFVPRRVGATAAVGADGATTLEFVDLPAADVLVGEVTGRVGYASIVVFDDRDGDGALGLREPREPPDEEDHHGPPREPPSPDVVYGASFVSMAEPDLRVAYREGGFDAAAAFYPRYGCPPPPAGFSVLGSGGFTLDALLSSLVLGELPVQDPAGCSSRALEVTPLRVALRPPAEVSELACTPRRRGHSGFGLPDYDEPPELEPDLATLPWACVRVPDLAAMLGGGAGGGGSGGAGGGAGGGGSGGAGGGGQPPPGPIELVVAVPGAEPEPDECRLVMHYLLRGCDDDPGCVDPEWDRTASPPDWWPCPREAP